MLKRNVILFVLGVALLAGARGYAQTIISTTISDAAENPPTVPTLSTGAPRPASFGTATFTLNSTGTAMTFTATVFNIDFTGSQTPDPNDNLVAAHIHAGPTFVPTVNLPVVWGFFGNPFNDNNPNDVVVTPFPNGVGGTISGKWDTPEGNNTTLAAQLPNILAGRAYINFHTTQFPGGELRGVLKSVPGLGSGTTLPTGQLNTPYSQTLTATGGTPPYTWTSMSGGLPPGLTMSSEGVISGIPAATITSNFVVGLTDAASTFATQNLRLTIVPSSMNFTAAARVAHVVDGGGLLSQLAVVNLDPFQVSYQFRFWGDNGTPLSLPIQSGVAGDVAGTLAPGAMSLVQTSGNSSPALQGWAEVASTGRIGVFEIFRRTNGGSAPDSETTVHGTPSGNGIVLPYDNLSGFLTGVAIANSNPNQSVTVSMTFTNESGVQSSASISLPAHGHAAFTLPANYPATANGRGSIRFAASTPDISVVGLRFSPNNSFTLLDSFQ